MTVITVIITALLSVCVAFCFRLLPQKWLCDYNESPSEIHLPERRRLPAALLLLLCAFGGIAALLFMRAPQTLLAALSFSVCCPLLILIAICDIKYQIIPNELLLLCLAFGLPLAFKNGWQAPLYGFLIGGVGLFCIIFITGKLLKAEAMGMGDILLSALCGILAGGAGYIAIFFTAVILAGAFYAVLLLLKRVNAKSRQPFGPFLVLGALSALCFANEWQALFNWYIGAF